MKSNEYLKKIIKVNHVNVLSQTRRRVFFFNFVKQVNFLAISREYCFEGLIFVYRYVIMTMDNAVLLR